MRTRIRPSDCVGKFVRLLATIFRRPGELPAGTVLRCTGLGVTRRGLTLELPRPVFGFDGLGPVVVTSVHVVELVEERHCRMCGCTNRDCRSCVEATGEPCEWVEADLCSACVEGRHDA